MEQERKIIIAGFGGQGIVFAGQLLATAAMKEDYYVTVLPSYGPEMRGGTANCTVVISPDVICSPVVERPNVLITLNQPSLERFSGSVENGGIVLLNSSLALPIESGSRSDLTYYEVKATDIAVGLGDIRVANVVAIGAFNSVTGTVKLESLRAALQEMLAEKKSKLVALNLTALDEGARIGDSLRQKNSGSAKT